jgi:hypothetical protein
MTSKRKRLILLVAIIALSGLVLVIRQNLPPEPVPAIVNPSFEPDEAGDALAGWNSGGIVESDGRSGGMRLTHLGGEARVETSQTLTNVPNGWYTLKVWVRSSGKQKEAYISNRRSTTTRLTCAKAWENLAASLKEGYRAVKDCSPSTQVMLHIAEGGDNELARWWFDNALEREAPFDVIGLSYYPYWHGALADLQNNLNDIAIRYDKDIIVVETAYPFTPGDNDGLQNIIRFQTTRGYPATPEGQVRMLGDIMTIVRAVPDGRGLGTFYWDATWTAMPGNGWENQALFDFDNRALPALSLFGAL